MLCLKYTNIPDPPFPPLIFSYRAHMVQTPAGLRIYGNECSYSVDHQRHRDQTVMIRELYMQRQRDRIHT
jgi:hypothetical protein